jgi:hypothetical protein
MGKRVLSEEEYMARLSAIICRDFFPLLAEGSLEALSSEEQVSLAQFQAKYTTEDDASFAQLLERENALKRAKYERVYGGPARLVDDPNRRLLLQPSRFDEHYFKKPVTAKLLTSGNATSPSSGTEPTILIQNTRLPRGSSKSRRRPNSEASSVYTIPTPYRDDFGDFGGDEPLSRRVYQVPATPVRDELVRTLSPAAHRTESTSAAGEDKNAAAKRLLRSLTRNRESRK